MQPPRMRYVAGRLESILEECPKPGPGAREIGNWLYEPGKGFYAASRVATSVTDPEEVSQLLDKALVGDVALEGAQLHPQPIAAHYQIDLDEQRMIRITLTPKARLIGQWMDAGDGQLYRLEGLRWPQMETHLRPDELQQHLAWFHTQKGWTVHETGLPLSWAYYVDEEGNLQFFWEAEGIEGGPVVDLGEWLYVPDEGLFRREPPVQIPVLSDGLVVPAGGVSHFLRSYRSQLDLVSGLFATESPIQRAGLQARLLEDGRVETSPYEERAPGYEQAALRRWDELVFVPNSGFWLLPKHMVLPEEWRARRVIDIDQLDDLRPYLVEVDPRLMPPTEQRARLTQLRPAAKRLARSPAHRDQFGCD